MPGNLLAPSLAESWTVSPDQRTYEFKLREGLKFHNGDPFTAEDVKFSFHPGEGRPKILHDKVREVAGRRSLSGALPSARAWPDFMTFYGTLVTAARAGSYPRSTWSRWATTASRCTPSASAPTSS